MKPVTLILVLVAAALAVAPLAGCRSAQRPSQPVAMQPAPAVPPAPVTYSSPAPTYVSPPVYSALPPPPAWSGAPDGTLAAPEAGFPSAAPAPSGDLTAAIAEEREARVRLDQELTALQERLRRAQAAPAATAPTGGGAGEQQAARFAQAIRTRSAGEVEQRGSVVVIRFTDAFQPGSESLKQDPRVTAALLATAEELLQAPGAVVEVVGHSDSTPIKVTRGKWRDNVHLSQERAQTVANALAKQGVPSGRLAVNGRGSVEPLVFPERSDKDRAKNRRVEILVRF